jgi:hypothetical protein
VLVHWGQHEHGLALDHPAAAGYVEVQLAAHPFLPVKNLTIEDGPAALDAVAA